MSARDGHPEGNVPGAPPPGLPGESHLEYLLTAYIFGDISEAGRREVEKHLASCTECRGERESLITTLATLKEVVGPGPAAAEGYSFEARRLERVLAARRERGWRGWMRSRRMVVCSAAAAILIVSVTVLFLATATLGKRYDKRSAGHGEYLAARAPGASPESSRQSTWAVEGEPLVVANGEAAPGLSTTYRVVTTSPAPTTGTPVEGIQIVDAARASDLNEGTRVLHGWNFSTQTDQVIVDQGIVPGGQSAAPITTTALPSAPGARVAAGAAAPAAAPAAPPPAEEAATPTPSPAAAASARELAAALEAPVASPSPAWREAAGKPAVKKDNLARIEELGESQGRLVAQDGADRRLAEVRAPRTREPTSALPREHEVYSASRSFRNAALPEDATITASIPRGATLDALTNLQTEQARKEFKQAARSYAQAGQDRWAGKPESGREVAATPAAPAAGPVVNAVESRFLDVKKKFLEEAGVAGQLAKRDEDEPTRFHTLSVEPDRLMFDQADLPPDGDATARRISGNKQPTAAKEGEIRKRRQEERLAEKDQQIFRRGVANREAANGEAPKAAATETDKSLVFEEDLLGIPTVTRLADSDGVMNTPDDRPRSFTSAGAEPPIGAQAPRRADKVEMYDQVQLGGANRIESASGLWLDRGKEQEKYLKSFLQVDRADVPAVAGPESSVHPGYEYVSGRGKQVLGEKPELGMLFRAKEALARERRLRAYKHFKALDPTLTLETFSAREIPVPSPTVGDEGLGQEGFRQRYGVNPFVDTGRDHFSTFGMDVDTASYTLARNTLSAGKLPDPRTVRVEEFINYFPEEAPADPGQVFSVFSEGGPSPFGEGLELLKISVKARDLRPGERKDAVLTFAVDTSGSMATPAQLKSGQASSETRLKLVRESLAALVTALGPDDRVGIVAYSSQPYLLLPHTPAREAERILAAIGSLAPSGATNVEAGLDLAYRVADEVFQPKAVNRVILCSDGVANAGARGPEEILEKVRVFAGRGIFLSCVGVGMGRYNDSLLETLANKGNGNYAYVDSASEAEKIFRESLPATLQVLAQDAKIQVDFNALVVSHYRLLGYENRDIADKDFRNDKVDAGEVGPGSTVTVLYEIRRKSSAAGDLGRVYLRYRDTGTGRVEEASYPLSPGVLATSHEGTSDSFRFTACVAELAELLRSSYWSRDGSYGNLLSVLYTVSPEFRARPQWREIEQLARRALELTLQ